MILIRKAIHGDGGANGEERTGEQPERNQEQVDDGVEAGGGVHRPGNDEAKRGERKRHQEDVQNHQQQLHQAEVNSEQRRDYEEEHALQGCQRGAAQNLAQHDHRAMHRGHQHGEQKALVAILDQRHHGEDRGEEHDHHQRTGEEEVEIVLAASGDRIAKGIAEAGSDDDPEDQGRGDDANHTAEVAVEAHHLAPPQRERGHDSEGGSRDRYRMRCCLRCQVQPQSCLVLFLFRLSGALFQALGIFVPEAVAGAANEDVLQRWLADAD